MKNKLPNIRQTKAQFNTSFQKLKNVLAGICMLAFAFVLTGTVHGQNWSDPPSGYSRVFYEDFSEPYTGDNSWQGVNQNVWEVRDRKSNKWPMEADNVMVKSGGGLYTYGGRLPSVSSTDNTIEDDEVSTSAISTKENIVRPGSSGPRIIRIRTEWDQRYGYIFQPWAFSSWVDVDGGGHTYRHGWEFDLETKGSEYDPVNRTFVAHFNNHTWVRVKGDPQRSQQSMLQATIQLPDDPRAQITIEHRWRRGEDFYDPYQTYEEWWVEEVENGVATGNMVRRYHWSPRHILEIFRSRGIPIPDDAPPAEPLPAELEAVAPMNKNYFPKNPYYPDTGPWNALGERLFRPLIAAEDGYEGYTYLDAVKDSWTDEGAGSLIWWNGFAKDEFFLSDDKPLYVSDYDDHHSHMDDHQCFSTVVWGVAVFDLDESGGNQAPVADAGPDQTVPDSDDSGSESVTLDGSGSSDPDGSISSYEWSEDGTQIATGATPTVNLATGSHTITLKVTDNEGATDSDDVVITVGTATVYQAEDYTSQSGCTVNTGNAGYTGTGYLDYGGNGSYGEWNNISVSSSGTQTIDFYYANGSSGNRQCELKVNGAAIGNISFAPTGSWTTWMAVSIEVNLNSGNNTVRVTANTANGGPNLDKFELTGGTTNEAPVADAGPDQTVIDSDDSGSESVTLDGSGSSDSDGSISSYEWSKDGSQIATGETPTVDLATGTHTITLTVTDDEGATDSDDVVITVETAGDEHVWLEAECGTVGSNWNTPSDANASNDEYAAIQDGLNSTSGAPAGTDDRISYNFDVAVSGNYIVWGRVISPNSSDDSFWVRMDGGSWINWNNIAPHDPDWQWLEVHDTDNSGTVVSFDLSSGSHTLDIAYREDGTKLDKLYITNSGSAPSGEGSTAGNCGTTNDAPVADAGSDQTVTDSDDSGSESVTLDGSGSSDSDGSISSYEWSKDGSQIATGETPTVDLDVGSHTITLTVTDDEGATDNDDLVITVEAASGQIAYAIQDIPGTIEAEDYDEGGQDVAYYDTDAGNNGGEYRSDDVDIQVCDAGGYNLGWTADGEWLEYTISSVSDGTYDMTLYYASKNDPTTGELTLILAGTTLGTFYPEYTGGAQTWQTATINDVSITGGSDQILRFDFTNGKFNVDKIVFSELKSKTIFTSLNEDNNNDLQVYSHLNNIYILSESLIENARVTVYSMLGNKVWENTMDLGTRNTIQLNQPIGCYIIEVVIKNQVKRKKLFIE